MWLCDLWIFLQYCTGTEQHRIDPEDMKQTGHIPDAASLLGSCQLWEKHFELVEQIDSVPKERQQLHFSGISWVPVALEGQWWNLMLHTHVKESHMSSTLFWRGTGTVFSLRTACSYPLGSHSKFQHIGLSWPQLEGQWDYNVDGGWGEMAVV